jgi:hypothetical protein
MAETLTTASYGSQSSKLNGIVHTVSYNPICIVLHRVQNRMSIHAIHTFHNINLGIMYE